MLSITEEIENYSELQGEKTYQLEVREDERSGTLGVGWKKLIHAENIGYSTEGALIAHDILEHVNKPEDIGAICEELEALGGLWFVRGEMEQIRPRMNVSSVESLSYELTDMARDFIGGEELEKEKYKLSRLCVENENFVEMVKLSRKQLREELECDDYIEDIEKAMLEANKFYSYVVPAMEAGYLKAEKMYVSSSWACSLFWEVATTIENHLKYEELFEGKEFELRIDFSRACAYMETTKDWEDYLE